MAVVRHNMIVADLSNRVCEDNAALTFYGFRTRHRHFACALCRHEAVGTEVGQNAEAVGGKSCPCGIIGASEHIILR